MILYLDASALVKRYVAEAGSAEVAEVVAAAESVGTAAISRAEVAAAFSRAARGRLLDPDEARAALQAFRIEWPSIVRLQISEALMAQADEVAWEYGLRGYDAVHLAAARFWQSSLGEPVTLATFDRELWLAASQAGLAAWPARFPNQHRS